MNYYAGLDSSLRARLLTRSRRSAKCGPWEFLGLRSKLEFRVLGLGDLGSRLEVDLQEHIGGHRGPIKEYTRTWVHGYHGLGMGAISIRRLRRRIWSLGLTVYRLERLRFKARTMISRAL